MVDSNHDTLVHRLSMMLLKLNQGEALDPKALAVEFGVNLRTIQRDLNSRFTYLPLEKADGRYRMATAFLGRLTHKDVQSFAALAGVQRLFPQLSGEFLRDVFDARVQSSILVRGHYYEDLSHKGDLFRLLESAITICKRISFRQARNGSAKLFEAVEPYKLLNHKGIWYLAATDRARLTTFSFSSISDLLVTDDTFRREAEIEKALLGDSLWVGGPPMEVIVSVAPAVAHYFQRRPILVNQSILEVRADGGLLIATRVGHENEVLPQVRFWIPHVQIVKPNHLRLSLASQLQDYLSQDGLSLHKEPTLAPKGHQRSSTAVPSRANRQAKER